VHFQEEAEAEVVHDNRSNIQEVGDIEGDELAPEDSSLGKYYLQWSKLAHELRSKATTSYREVKIRHPRKVFALIDHLK
jgi:hypothetical protein